MCGGGCVAEFADDGGEEEGRAVEGADDAPVHLIAKFASAAGSVGIGVGATNSTGQGRFANQ